ncbi:centrosomal protein 43 [Cherax quadricarinatus]
MSIEEEEDASLKELVTKTLHNKGVLGKIQAQLRASVFLALEDEFKDKNIPLVSTSARKLLGTPEGATAAALIQDFLQCLGLEFSLAVFAPESGHSTVWSFPGTEALTSNLSLRTEKDHKTPLLMELLRERKSSVISHTENNSSEVKPALNRNKEHSQLPVLNGVLPHSHATSSSQLLKTQPESNPSNISLKNGEPDGHDASEKREAEKRNAMNKANKNLPKETVNDGTENSTDGLSFKLTSDNDYLSSRSKPDRQKGGVDSNTVCGFPALPPVEKNDTHNSLNGEEKQYEDDFSSMSDKEEHDGDDEVEEEEEEGIEEAEDIDESISIDDLINSSASGGSDHTKDVSLSQASDVASYQESL